MTTTEPLMAEVAFALVLNLHQPAYNLKDLLEGVLPAEWRNAVVGERGRVERIPYERCVLRSLDNTLRRREIWVVGASRWRDPEADLPADLGLNRELGSRYQRNEIRAGGRPGGGGVGGCLPVGFRGG